MVYGLKWCLLNKYLIEWILNGPSDKIPLEYLEQFEVGFIKWLLQKVIILATEDLNRLEYHDSALLYFNHWVFKKHCKDLGMNHRAMMTRIKEIYENNAAPSNK